MRGFEPRPHIGWLARWLATKAKVLFFEGDEPCEISYADKKGKYQGQQSIVLPKL